MATSGPMIPHDAKIKPPAKSAGSGKTLTGNVAGKTNAAVSKHNATVFKNRPMLRK